MSAASLNRAICNCRDPGSCHNPDAHRKTFHCRGCYTRSVEKKGDLCDDCFFADVADDDRPDPPFDTLEEARGER